MPPSGGRPATRRTYGIAVLDRMAELVGAMIRTGPATLSRLAAESGCAPATAFRILRTMQSHGLAEQDEPRGPWRLGVAWLIAAQAAAAQGALALAAQPAMAALAHTSDETVYLAVRDGQEAEMAAIRRGATLVRLYARPGERLPLHAGPHRLLLAYAPPDIQAAVLASRLARLTPMTRIDPPWIKADLPRIRARGWLITTDEMAEGAVTVTTGVSDSAGTVLAALTIAGPVTRMRPPRPHTLLGPLLTAAEAVRGAISRLG